MYVPTRKSNLPKLKLPGFSGNFIDYTNFINAFELAVSQDQSLTKLEKFLHLKACLSGEALQTIGALEVTNDNYEVALKMLESRYGNKLLIFQSHISKLFDMPAAHKGNATQIRSVIDEVNVHMKALQSLGNSEEILSAALIHLAKRKLDTATIAKWEESLDYSSIPLWDEFYKFLDKRCQYLSNREPSRKSDPPMVNRKSTFTVCKTTCPKCKKADHNLHKCPIFTKLPVLDRFSETKRLGLCINCLKKGHSVKDCHSSSCRICGSLHHTLLHRFEQLSSTSKNQHPLETPKVAPQSDSTNLPTSLVSSTVPIKSNQVILATAIIHIQQSNGQSVPVRALLDSASQLNFVTDSLSQRLNLKRHRVDMEITGIGHRSSKIQCATNITIKSRINQFTTNVETCLLPTITGAQPEHRINISNWEIPCNIPLADPHFNIPGKIDLLLGAEEFYQLLSVGQIKLGDNFPVLQKTEFGWTVSGSLQSSNQYNEICNVASESSC